MKNVWVYDIESYPNIFTLCAVYGNGKGIRVFEVSDRKNDTELLLEWLRNVYANNHKMAGFNNVGYDYNIVHRIIDLAKEKFGTSEKVDLSAKQVYSWTCEIIESSKGGRWGTTVKEADVMIPQIDLFKIHHFDNPAKATSLKMLEFNMRSENVEDLPFPVGKVLTFDEMDVLIEYNRHDVMQTLKFLAFSKEAVQLREQLSAEYGWDCTNFNDTKIGKELFVRTLEAESPGICYSINPHGGRKVKQTKRDEIVIADCLFPYIRFEREEFVAIHNWFKAQRITETKGVFSDLMEHSLGDVAKYAEMVTKKKKLVDPNQDTENKCELSEEFRTKMLQSIPLSWIEEKPLKSPKGAKSWYLYHKEAETLNVVVNGFRFDFGTGGIHGAKQGVVRSTKDRVILTYDVASYYPNMAIANGVFPAHLGKTFCSVYKDLYDKRKTSPKGSAKNSALKLALNGVYGDSNNEYSPLYDPAYTMAITIGGQLSLCMLVEALLANTSAEMVMANTDGIEFTVAVDEIDTAKQLVAEWEKTTGLTMEGDTYDVMYIRDVNSYFAITTSGKIKLKGAYEYGKDSDGNPDYTKLGWHKNHSALVVPMAVEHELLGRGIAVEFIHKHDNLYDFMLRTKVDRSSRLVLVDADGNDQILQNICRYYPSEWGGKLVKIMPPLKGKEEAGERRLGIDTEWNVLPCNDISEFNWGKLNYDYYEKEVEKLLSPFREQP